jgi:putative MFS transporter
LNYGVGRLANVVGPMLVAFLFTHYGYLSVFIYIGALWVAVALVIGIFGPNTRGRILT